MKKTIIIVGVPRSGTTLLRVLLGENPLIASLPETPWITGAQNVASLKGLLEHLVDSRTGPVQSISSIEAEDLIRSARAFLDHLFGKFCALAQKEYLCMKTPDDIIHLNFLVDLYPDAQWIHIKRDPRDVALSTVRVKNDLLGKKIHQYGANNISNALKRWFEWEDKIAAFSSQNSAAWFHIGYEDLLADPVKVMQNLESFLGLESQELQVHYHTEQHDLPYWEQGSADVRMHGGKIDATRRLIWKKQFSHKDLSLIDRYYGDQLVAHGYERYADQDFVADFLPRRLFAMSYLNRERCEKILSRAKRVSRIPEHIGKSVWQILKHAFFAHDSM